MKVKDMKVKAISDLHWKGRSFDFHDMTGGDLLVLAGDIVTARHLKGDYVDLNELLRPIAENIGDARRTAIRNQIIGRNDQACCLFEAVFLACNSIILEAEFFPHRLQHVIFRHAEMRGTKAFHRSRDIAFIGRRLGIVRGIYKYRGKDGRDTSRQKRCDISH